MVGFQAFCRDIDVYSFEFPAPEPEPELVLLRECAGVLTSAIPTVRSRFGNWTSPALLLRGEQDIGTLGDGSLPGCELGSCVDLLAGASTTARASLMFYEGMKHEIIFEQYPCMEGNIVVDDIVVWLKRQATLHFSEFANAEDRFILVQNNGLR